MAETARRGRKPIVDENSPGFEELRASVETLLNVPKTAADVAQLSGVSTSIINRWIRAGIIKRDTPARRGPRPTPLQQHADCLMDAVREHGAFPRLGALLKATGVSRATYRKVVDAGLVDVSSLLRPGAPGAPGSRRGRTRGTDDAGLKSLLPYCVNEREKTIISALLEGKSFAQVVESLNPRRSTSEVQSVILRLKARAWDAICANFYVSAAG
jgi:hypothetical protein